MGTWSYGQDYTNPRDPETLAELVFICRMPISGVEELSEIAQDMTIPQDCAWNCQDYVIELVEELGLKGLLEDGWETGRDTIRRGKERHQ